MDDLFGDPIVSGLSLGKEITSIAEEAELIARIKQVDLRPFRFQQWTGKRLTRSFGWSYDFEDGSFARSEPIPDWLEPLRARAARFARLGCDDLVQALLTRYGHGAGIGWHKDRPVFEHIVGISLGTEATLRLRRRRPGHFERAKVLLPPRSIYHLEGEVRHQWEHSIAPIEIPRWSVTFRSLAPKGLRA